MLPLNLHSTWSKSSLPNYLPTKFHKKRTCISHQPTIPGAVTHQNTRNDVTGVRVVPVVCQAIRPSSCGEAEKVVRVTAVVSASVTSAGILLNFFLNCLDACTDLVGKSLLLELVSTELDHGKVFERPVQPWIFCFLFGNSLARFTVAILVFMLQVFHFSESIFCRKFFFEIYQLFLDRQVSFRILTSSLLVFIDFLKQLNYEKNSVI